MCPNCQEIKEWLSSSDEVKITGDVIDATDDDGMELSKKYGVMSVPTMLFLNEKDEEETRATELDEIKKVLKNKSLLDI